MTDPEIRALVERLEADMVALGGLSEVTVRRGLLKQAAATITALAAERDEAREALAQVYVPPEHADNIIARAMRRINKWNAERGTSRGLVDPFDAPQHAEAVLLRDLVLALKSARRAAFARAKEIAEAYRDSAKGFVGDRAAAEMIAAAIEAEMGTLDERQHSVEALPDLEPKMKDNSPP